MKRNVLSGFLVFVVLFSMFLIPLGGEGGIVFAQPDDTVIPESDLEWQDLGDGNARITNYTGTAKHNLVLPGTVGGLIVTEIGDMFSIGSSAPVFNNKGLTGSFTIPDGVEKIGFNAFNSNELTTVIFPNSVKEIGNTTFAYNKITNVVIPDSVTNIGRSAFGNNSFESILDLELPSHLDYYFISGSLSHIIEMPEHVVIPSEISGHEVTEIPRISGYHIKSITVPETVTSVGPYIFDLEMNLGTLENLIFLRGGTDWTIDEEAFFSDMTMESFFPENFEIVGHLGSTAETFAQQNDVTFVDVCTIDVPTNTTCDNPTYMVTYNGNTSTGGNVPTDNGTYEEGTSVTVLGNTGNLVKPGYTFAGWNTAADGNGTTYAAEATFLMGTENVTLYAVWTENPTYTVTYNSNTSAGGTVPTDNGTYEEGTSVTVLGNTGNLVKPGYTFAGWNTAADGNGTT